MLRIQLAAAAHRPKRTCLSISNRIHDSLRFVSTVRIGHVERKTRENSSGQPFVPHGYLPAQPSDTLLSHLQWMMQKDNLRQDMLLVAPPNCLTRRIPMMYAEMMQQPVQVVTLSSDITESDLKQRRELTSGGVDFINQAPVRAALEGHLLILDGLHKTERNVLPTLNNLLENREMNLEDGRFIVSPERYKELGGSSSFLVPSHPDFRVVATAVPSPPYTGRSLDPPLRSRFQIRRIDNESSDELYETLVNEGMEESVAKTCSIVSSILEHAAHQDAPKSSHFPVSASQSVAAVMNRFPHESKRDVLARTYPYGSKDSRLQEQHVESQQAFDHACNKLKLPKMSKSKKSPYEITDISPVHNNAFAQVTFSGKGEENLVTVTVPSGGNELRGIPENFVETIGSKTTLTRMMQEHYAGRDMLLTSPKGEGKSATASVFCSMLGYKIHLFSLYKEMTARELLMRRTTTETGETGWEESPLVAAAKSGQVCILDGIEKLNSDALCTLQGFLTDREVILPNGEKLVGIQHQQQGASDGIGTIHTSFRVIALASIPNTGRLSWMNEELNSMFSTIPLATPSRNCLEAILNPNGALSEDDLEKILNFSHNLTGENALNCGVSPLSTRNLVRLVKQRAAGTNLHDSICSLLVAQLLPPTQRASLESLLSKCGIVPKEDQVETPLAFLHSAPSINVTSDKVSIGDFSMQRQTAERPEMVPKPFFFDIPNHVLLIKSLLSQWVAGERAFLLLGNQGVGKNKVVDRLCEVANFEREYIQLHRDSTVGQLTLSPSLEDGKIVWKDSPLVRAVTRGCTLVIDEADKAPLEVISVLKALIEDGELLLADGRRISRNATDQDAIQMKSGFTVFVLANRPGFPFHGNDFFREIGDCFSAQVVPNPDIEDEIELLQSYAPNVPIKMLRRIAASFAELRNMAEIGDIAYPYSTREAVAVVKHLERYPKDDIVSVLFNVLSIDTFNNELFAQLSGVFREHGFPVQSHTSWNKSASGGDLAIEYLTDRTTEGKSSSPPPLSGPKRGKWDDKNEAHVGGNQWAGGTGGSDTAGLGGRGGPYRLDRGHKVHQVSDEAKAQVSEEAAAAAREIAEKSLKERLQEIGMSETEHEMYSRFVDPIKSDIANLRASLQSVESRTRERDWIKRQSYGELDDSKLVEGVAGERYIYKRRGTVEPRTSASATKPRRLRFVVDCSGSMYRFNGYDERLNRCLEAAALVMESFNGMETRFDYSIVGHSGDSKSIELVPFGSPPGNDKERMRVLQKMVAHSQFCQSGDNTLPAIKQAVKDVSRDDDDDCVVIAVSDANLARYGIAPRELGRAMTSDSNKTRAFCVFIASFGSEADDIRRELPLGRGFVCMQTSELPRIVRNILTTEMA